MSCCSAKTQLGPGGPKPQAVPFLGLRTGMVNRFGDSFVTFIGAWSIWSCLKHTDYIRDGRDDGEAGEIRETQSRCGTTQPLEPKAHTARCVPGGLGGVLLHVQPLHAPSGTISRSSSSSCFSFGPVVLGIGHVESFACRSIDPSANLYQIIRE